MMYKRFALLAMSLSVCVSGWSWGFYGHIQINRMAVFCLPPQLFGFYKNHIDYVGQHAVDADKRRYAISEEACRH